MRRKNIYLQNITITGVAAEGKALAKLDGKVLFVEGAIPGDVVDIRLTKSKKDWAEAVITTIVTPSPQRVAAFCLHFGLCGGCKWQMLPYELQLQYKQNEVLQNLTRLGKIELPAINTILGSERQTEYRNKLEFTFSNKRYRTTAELAHCTSKTEIYNLPAEPALGYHVPKLFDKIIPIQHCHLMAEPTNSLRNYIFDFCVAQNYPFYDVRNHTGWLRNLMLRITTTGQVMLNVILAYDGADTKVLLDNILKKFTEITSLQYTINNKHNDSIYDLTPIVYYGKAFIVEQLEQFMFTISAKSFFQTNTKQAEILYQVTRNYAELTGTQVLYDLYCGTGSIGIFCSAGAAKVIGVELIPEAIENAKQNAAINHITHTYFFAGDVAAICNNEFFETHGRPDVIVTDPPRAGMHAALIAQIVAMQAPIVVYVSCNSATQARDLQLLDAYYKVTAVQPVDMFPHTHHIENVVQLKLR